MLLVDKYKPRNLKQVIGQEDGIERLKSSVIKGKHCLLCNGVGNGKTSSVYALANELGFEVFELNASDSRSKERVNSILNGAALQMSLMSRGKIILVDDVDALSGNDRGGLQAIIELAFESSHPFVFTCYNIDDGKFKQLKHLCEVVEFCNVDYFKIINLLKEICRNENMSFNEKIIKNIARKCNGDIRSAINELELFMISGQDNEFYYKDSRAGINDFLNIVFKSRNFDAIMKIGNELDENLDEVMLWIDENLPNEYDALDLDKAYDALSKADLFKGRIRKKQYYRYIVYQKFFMGLGVALGKKEKNNKMIKYKRTSRLLKIWLMNRKIANKKLIAEDIAGTCHMSRKKAFKELEFMGFVDNNNI